VEDQDDDGGQSFDPPTPTSLSPRKWRMLRISNYVSFVMLAISVAFWPWAYVAFDLLSLWVGLLSIWAITIVAWAIASPPSAFPVIFGLCSGFRNLTTDTNDQSRY